MGAVEEMMCVVYVSDLFVLSWERVVQMRRGIISSELLMCGGCVCSILLLPLVSVAFLNSA